MTTLSNKAAEIVAQARAAASKVDGWHPELASILCDAEREIRGLEEAEQGLTVADAWDELVNVDDRTSPEEYPDMCLITRDELADFMTRAALPNKVVDTQELADELEAVQTGSCYNGVVRVDISGDLRDRILSALRTTQAQELDSRPDIQGDPAAKIMSYNDAHEDAVEMGYPSITEALEHLEELRTTHSPSEAALRDEWSDCGNLGWCVGDESHCTRHNPDGWADAIRRYLLSDKTVELLRDIASFLRNADRYGFVKCFEKKKQFIARIDSHLGEKE